MLYKIMIGLVIFVVIFTIIGRIRYHSKATQERLAEYEREKQNPFRNYSGRARGKIIEHHWEQHSGNNGIMNLFRRNTDVSDDQNDVFMVSYEFEVNGQTYTGEGMGNPDVQERNYQTICYDPSDPNINCTFYYMKSKTPNEPTEQ